MSSTDEQISEGQQKVLDEWAHMLANPEPLHPDLLPWVEDNKFFGKTLKHPLLVVVPFTDQWSAMYNKQYLHKKELLAKFLAEKQWGRAAFLTERPYRVNFLYDHADEIEDDKEYWETLAWVYTDSENLWQVEEQMAILLDSERPGRRHMMDEEEQAIFDQLPNKIRVYRGHREENQLGFAWTLSSTKASWFAARFSKNGTASMAFVSKADVYAYKSGRGEYEIVTHGSYVQDVQPYRVPRMSSQLQTVLTATTAAFTLGQRTDHGPNHWRQVDRIGVELCKTTKKADKQLVRLFSIIHDHLRENEMEDPLHGHRAAAATPALLEKCGVKLSFDRLNVLLEAIRYHNDGLVTECPTIGTCWDSDRLDLPRVGIIPDPKLLSTQAAKDRILTI